MPEIPILRNASDRVTAYAWDFENRLTTVTLPNGKVHSFSDDPFGRRILRTAQNKTRVYAYDGDNIVEELKETGSPAIRYTQGLGIDEPLATTASGVASYYHADGSGSITSLTNASGIVVNAYEYDSFGRLTSRNETVSNTIGYTAREDDGQTGLYYYRARYYDPSTGRFLSEDPVQFGAGVNFFSYVFSNPVNLTDPTGLFSKGWHYKTTYDLAKATFGNRPGCEYKAHAVATANMEEDEIGGGILSKVAFISGFGGGWSRPGPHFPDDRTARGRLDHAMQNCSLEGLGKALHTLQDAYAHSGAYANPRVHWTTTILFALAGGDADTSAEANITLVDGATAMTASVLQSFKRKCLGGLCCD
jgi:RHS repeat-associated protein